MLPRAHLRATLGLTALLALSPAVAGTFTISPLRVDLSARVVTAALTVRNDSDAAVVVQAQPSAWSQEHGEDALQPSQDLLVSPAVFTLPAGGKQVLRVALRRPADPARELSYRLALQEVPQPAAPGFTGMQVALRLSVPVFVAPAAKARPELAWSLDHGDEGRLAITARNDGTAHARIHRFVVRNGTTTVAEHPALAYVLPGATRRFTFDDGSRASASEAVVVGTTGDYRLEGVTDEGPFAAELSPAQD